MLLSPSRKFVFIHIQKTAGSSVEKALRSIAPDAIARFDDLPACRAPLKNRHLFASDLLEYLGNETWNTYYKFAFVRNPWSRLVSWYNMCIERPSNPFMHFVKLHARTLEEFLSLTDGRCSKTMFNQIDYIGDQSGNLLVDFVGRFETLKRDFDRVCERLNIDIRLPHVNRGPATDYREWYNERTRQIVAERFFRDIQAFGYKFEEE